MSMDQFNTPEYKARNPESYPRPGVLTKDDTHVLVKKRYFDSMDEYSTSIPTGKIPGKHWKCLCRDGVWIIRWYEEDPTDDQMLLIPQRIAIVID
jgi:hypothetical protein